MKRIEDFRKSFNKVMIDLDAFIESLQDLKTMRPTEINEILKRRSGTNVEMQNIVKMIIKNGESTNAIWNVLIEFYNNNNSNTSWRSAMLPFFWTLKYIVGNGLCAWFIASKYKRYTNLIW